MNTSFIKKEKRKNERLPLNLEVSYTTESRYKVEIMEGELINVTKGEGGICLKMSEQLAIDSKLMLKFVLPNSKTVFSTGYIKWVEEVRGEDKYLAGISLDMDEEDIDYLISSVTAETVN